MSKTQWIIEKCNALKDNLLFKFFIGNNQIYEQILKSDLNCLFNNIFNLFGINLYLYKYKIIFRKTETGYNQNWHLDGRRVFENRKGIICPSDPTDNSRFVLHNIVNNVPKYSILYYNSDYNVDFKGGTIEFINNQIIKPQKNLCILFDSNLGHRVNLQTSGIRECALILLYDQFKS
jgi:hypothetical protein